VYPKLFLNGGSMYETAWWRWLVAVWEALVYNPVVDLGACYQARWSPSPTQAALLPCFAP
jgi:hypothetical protein